MNIQTISTTMCSMNKSESTQILGSLEKEVMDVIWQAERTVKVQDVVNALSKKKTVAYTTVMTVMSRLTDKGVLKRKESGKAYLYLPKQSKEKFITQISRRFIRSFINSFGDAAVANFTEELSKISLEKRRELLKLLKGKK